MDSQLLAAGPTAANLLQRRLFSSGHLAIITMAVVSGLIIITIIFSPPAQSL